MRMSENVEEALKELYGIVETFVNKEEIGLDDKAKKRNLEAMGMVVDGVQLMADGLEQMDHIILKGLMESFMNAMMSNFAYDVSDMKSFMDLMDPLTNEPNASSWALEKMPEVKPEPKPEQKGED